jgi:two-component sensor histidine kinase/CHASE3 domain sensor protein
MVAGMALWPNWDSTRNLEALRRSSAVQASALTFLSRLQDAESGQRGYLLTGNQMFLEPYEQAVATLEDHLATLENNVRSDPEQLARVASLKVLLPRKVKELADTVGLVRDNRRADAVAVISATSGKATMDDIRMVVTQILKRDDNELIAREAELGNRNRLFTGIIAACAVTGFALIVFLLRIVPRQFASADRLRADLAGVNTELEGEVERRTREAETATRQAIAEKERAEAERSRVELLLQDVNHRIGNNLAMVSGMLGLQVSSTSDESVRAQLRAAQARIATIANAQRRLRLGSDLTTVRADEMIENAVGDLRATLGTERHVWIDTRLTKLMVESRDAVHLAILVNELATNAVKHAFVGRDEGRILVQLATDASGCPVLAVEDDGCGMPDEAGAGGLGRKLVVSLARQFGGTPQVKPRPGGGTRVEIRLPDIELRSK